MHVYAWASVLASLLLAASACVPITQCGPAAGGVMPMPAPLQSPVETPSPGHLLPTPAPVEPRAGFGVGVSMDTLSPHEAEWLGVSWYLNWAADGWDTAPGVEFWPMVRVSQTGFRPGFVRLVRLAIQHPGSTWIIGNEPDVACWQDDVPARQYAMLYHVLYTLIKRADPTARVAIGGVAQPTELRLRYLDQVLDSYREFTGKAMPVDVWTIHAYILNEQRDSWGTGIPSGMDDVDQGELIDLDQHDDMDIFSQRILRFRRWMAQRGYRERELAVTEFGIVMPPEYGFGPERLRRFMWAAFEYFETASDAQVGLPSDGNRLVQRWAWFSLQDPWYPAGNLLDPLSGQLTPAGQAFAEYVRSRPRWTGEP